MALVDEWTCVAIPSESVLDLEAFQLCDEAREWLLENIGDEAIMLFSTAENERWSWYGYVDDATLRFVFRTSEDAALFKMVWG